MKLTYDVSKKNLDKDLEMLKEDRNSIIFKFFIYIIFTISLACVCYFFEFLFNCIFVSNNYNLLLVLYFILYFLAYICMIYFYFKTSFSIIDDIKFYLSRKRTINAFLVFREFTLNNIKYINQVKIFKCEPKKVKVDFILGDD